MKEPITSHGILKQQVHKAFNLRVKALVKHRRVSKPDAINMSRIFVASRLKMAPVDLQLNALTEEQCRIAIAAMAI